MLNLIYIWMNIRCMNSLPNIKPYYKARVIKAISVQIDKWDTIQSLETVGM